MNLAQQLLRSHLRDLVPYASARRSMSGGHVWLNANESPYCRRYQVNTDTLNRYPAFQSAALNEAYARYAGVDMNQVISHRGSDESIELLIRCFCEPGRDRILVCPPTYGMYKISAALNNTPVTEIPLTRESWQLDLSAIKKVTDEVKIVFLCNPSNPLGNALNADDVRAVVELFNDRALVVVDEAYIEYSTSKSMASCLAEYPNLVIMRTLSKAFGLAAARIGFTLANADVIAALVPALAPYPLPDLSIQIGEQALRAENLIEIRQNTIETLAERDRLSHALGALDVVTRVYSSDTNFVLIQVRDGSTVMRHCERVGILLRDQSAQPGLVNCLRITVGAPAENDAVLDVLRTLS